MNLFVLFVAIVIAAPMPWSFQSSWNDPLAIPGDRYIVLGSEQWDFSSFDTLSIGTATTSEDLVPPGVRRYYRVCAVRYFPSIGRDSISAPSAPASGMWVNFVDSTVINADTVLIYAGSAAPAIWHYEYNAGNVHTFLLAIVPHGWRVSWSMHMSVIGAPSRETVRLYEPILRKEYRR
jgi:hypothetical protein